LDKVLSALPRAANPNVILGFDTADDAGVYRLTDELALVQTVDFFTPIVDDPFTFGAIAAANSLSDVYAMGGHPISALSIAAFPGEGDMDTLAEIMRGGLEKLREAECALLGGHSVSDPEIKFGYAVTGTIHPGRVKANSGARPGDALILTKPLGTGVIGTALKRGIASEESLRAATESMLRLNREACDAMLRFDIQGCTDVTGFGLLGHAREMALASGVTLQVEASRVPLLPGALEALRAGAAPGGLKNNRDFVSCTVEVKGEIDPALVDLFYDPQTSGGLLIAVSESDAGALLDSLPGGVRIGHVTARDNKALVLV
jgi:selenide,water dikinase